MLGLLGLYSCLNTRYHEMSKSGDPALSCVVNLKFDRHLDSSFSVVPVKFQIDMIIQKYSFKALKLH